MDKFLGTTCYPLEQNCQNQTIYLQLADLRLQVMTPEQVISHVVIEYRKAKLVSLYLRNMVTSRLTLVAVRLTIIAAHWIPITRTLT